MKIYNTEKTQVIASPDLKKGYLIQDKIIIKTIPAQSEIQQKVHYEEVRVVYNSDGSVKGKEFKEVIDIPYQPAKPETYEYEDIQVYIAYTEKELLNIELNSLYSWFEEYDNQVKQYERCKRLGITFDKDINLLDNEAREKQQRIAEIRNLLKGV